MGAPDHSRRSDRRQRCRLGRRGKRPCGWHGRPLSKFNRIISSVSPDGGERWTNRFAGDAGLDNRPFELVVEGERIFASGLVGIPDMSTGNSCLVAWKLDGQQLWKNQVDTIANSPSRLAVE